MTAFVAEQRDARAAKGFAALAMPRKRVYRPADPAAVLRVRLDS